MTAVTMVALIPVHALGMYATFIKISNMFKPSNIQAKLRHKQRMKRILGR